MSVFVHLSVIILLLMVTKKQIEILLNGFLFRCLLFKGYGKGLKVIFHNNLVSLLVKKNFIFLLLIRILVWFIIELIPLSQCNILLLTSLIQLTGDFFIILLNAIISISFSYNSVIDLSNFGCRYRFNLLIMLFGSQFFLSF